MNYKTYNPMKRIFTLLLCIVAITQGAKAANIVEQSDSTKHYISENLVEQDFFNDYRKYIGCQLYASRNTTLYTYEIQTINIPYSANYLKMTYSQKKKSRTFYFDKIQTMVYEPQIINIVNTGTNLVSPPPPSYDKPTVSSHIVGLSFEIVDVIRFTEFDQIISSFNNKAELNFQENWNEVQNLKVKKKQLQADTEPKTLYLNVQPTRPNLYKQDTPVFILKDKNNKRCYWIPELKSTAYDMKEALVLTSYIDYLKHLYVGKTYYYKDSGKHFTIDDDFIVGVVGDIYIKTKGSVDMVTYSSFASETKERRLLTESEYADYIAEKERQRQLEEERRKEAARIAEEKRKQEERAAELKKQEEERQKKLEEQRKKQALVRKYGAHYAECIINKTLEIGMPIAVVKEILPIMKRTSRNVTRYETIEHYEGRSAESAGIGFVAGLFGLGELAEYSGLTKTYYLTFTNGKLTSYYD